MPEVILYDEHQEVRGHRLQGRTWSKAGVVLHFNDEGIAQPTTRDLARLDVASHPELEVVGDPFTLSTVVLVDSVDELTLEAGQTVSEAKPPAKPKAAPKPKAVKA